MPSSRLFEPLSLSRGPAMQNRLVLAPITNQQSYADGSLSSDEINWLAMRAAGGFGLIRTAAASVQQIGQGFPGQLGVYDDRHIPGLTELAATLRAQGALSAVQLYHGGDRASPELVGKPVSPSDGSNNDARALNIGEIEQLSEDFVAAALRAEKAGFDGVEVHGAHGYILAQFLSPVINRRTDQYGGSLENRSRLLLDVIDGIRTHCRPDFQIGLRLSPERFGMKLDEVLILATEIMRDDKIDYLDMSLWDALKEPHDEAHKGRNLLGYFTDIPRGNVRLGVAGKITTAAGANSLIEAGCDFVTIGRAAILCSDFPEKVRHDPLYEMPKLPVDQQHFIDQGANAKFVEYLRTFAGLVS